MTSQYPPPQPPNYGQQYPPQWTPQVPPKPKRRRWPWIVGGIVLLLVIIGMAGNKATSTPQVPTAPTWQSVTPAATAPAAAPPAQAGPQTSFGSGTFEVGSDIAPGKYKTTGPEGGLPSCYWARLKNTDGDLGSIIANGNAQGP